MKRHIQLILVSELIIITFFATSITPISGGSNSGGLEGDLTWEPTDDSEVDIGYTLSEYAGDGQTDYTLMSLFNIISPVQLNGLVDNWIIGGRNFSIQIYCRIATDFYLFQHRLNWSNFGVPANEFEDSFSFSLPQSYDFITLDYAMFSHVKENTTYHDRSGWGSGAISVINEKIPYYPRSFADISGEIRFYMEEELIFPLEYAITGDRRESPQVEMTYTLGQFLYEQPALGYIEGIPHYSHPWFTVGCAIFNITYTRSEGWINRYAKEYELSIGKLEDVSEDDMATGVSKTLTVDSGSKEMDSIKLRLIMDIYLFNWDLDFIFEKKPSIIAHFFRSYAAIIIAVGFLAVIVVVFIIRRRRF